MGVGIVSIIYGLIAGFLGYLLGQDSMMRKAERVARRRWYWDYLRVKR